MRRLRKVFLAQGAVGRVAFTVIGCNAAMDMPTGQNRNVSPMTGPLVQTS